MQPLYPPLILFPLVLAVASLWVNQLSIRRIVAVPANVLIAAGSVLLLFLIQGTVKSALYAPTWFLGYTI